MSEKKKTEIEKNCLFIIYRKLKLEKIGYLNQPKHVWEILLNRFILSKSDIKGGHCKILVQNYRKIDHLS